VPLIPGTKIVETNDDFGNRPNASSVVVPSDDVAAMKSWWHGAGAVPWPPVVARICRQTTKAIGGLKGGGWGGCSPPLGLIIFLTNFLFSKRLHVFGIFLYLFYESLLLSTLNQY